MYAAAANEESNRKNRRKKCTQQILLKNEIKHVDADRLTNLVCNSVDDKALSASRATFEGNWNYNGTGFLLK